LLSSAKELVAHGAAKLAKTINRAIRTVADYEIGATRPDIKLSVELVDCEDKQRRANFLII
jgi:hypothetical protein